MQRPHQTILVILTCLTCQGIAASTQGQSVEYATLSDKPASPFLVETFDPSLGGTPAGAALPVPNLAIDLIATFEGLEKKPYNDPSGYCTIGYGHLLAKARCTDAITGDFKYGITAEQARNILMIDAAQAGRHAANLAVVDLSDGQYGALSSFVFNFGATKFGNSTLVKLVRAEAHPAAALEFRRWVMSRNPKTGKLESLPGLVARRNCEAALYLDTLSPPFRRALCEATAGATPVIGPLIDVSVGEQGN